MGESSRATPEEIDNRRVNLFGADEDSEDSEDIEETNSGASSSAEEDDVIEDEQEEEEEEEEEGLWEDIYTSPDGTKWKRDEPSTGFTDWRNRFIEYEHGPTYEARPVGNEPVKKSSIIQMMLTEEVQTEICKWTNKLGSFRTDEWNKRNPNVQKPRIWKELTPRELRAFFGLLLLSGVEKPRKKPWHELWTTDKRFRCPAFPATMSRNRFYAIMSTMRFDDSVERHKRQEEQRCQGPGQQRVGLGNEVITQLCEPYRGSQRTVTADNFFTSLAVVKALLQMRLTYCGTLKKTRREVPAIARSLNLAQEENLFLYNYEDQITLLRHRTSRTRFVLLLSSAHYRSTVVTVTSRSKTKQIPEIIAFYNSNKVGVDVADQVLGNYTSMFPTNRWTMRIMQHLMDVIAYNAYIIYIALYPSWQAGTRSKRRIFTREVAYDLILPQIRYRAATVSNLHNHIAEAMLIMGVEYHKDRRSRSAAAAGTTRHGRCCFCGPSVSRKTTTRRCTKCSKFICGDCCAIICPDCLPEEFEDADEEESSEQESE